MLEINVDKDGYYANGSDGEIVEVKKIPCVEDVRYLQAYHYDNETQCLVLDDERLTNIINSIPTTSIPPTVEERLEAMEALMLEMLEGGE